MNTDARPVRVLLKALVLFVLINIVYGIVDPSLGAVSAYNSIFPGRVRFPFGVSADPYVVTVDNLDVMAASHAIAAPKSSDEYRVVIIGDSSVWGETFSVQDSISEQWNHLDNQCGERKIRFYNLGYPHPSVIKDMIILDKAMEYEPDMVVWFVTLNTIIPRRLSPFIIANRERATKILDTYDITYAREEELAQAKITFYDKTLVGRRSDLARTTRLQALGLVWKATSLDKRMSAKRPPLSQDVKDHYNYRGWETGTNLQKKMLLDALAAGHTIAKDIPVLLVNEPIYIASGGNSEIRYNAIYPRWAYDQYRQVLAAEAQMQEWNYLDLWDVVPAQFFSDTGLHVSAKGERILVEKIHPNLRAIACP